MSQAADLVVIYTDVTGSDFTLSPSQYGATGFGVDLGGSVTYPLAGAPIGTGSKLTIYRDVAATQPTSISNQGAMWPQVIEGALDRLAMIAQGFIDTASRSLKISSTDAGTLRPLPNSTQRANSFLAFDAAGQPVAALGIGLASVSSWLATNFLPLTSAAAARTALGAAGVAGDTFTGPINEAHGADVASAGTINLSTATGNVVDVTGTTTITAITLADGAERTVRFTGALVLTNGASLVLPTGANVATSAGDFAVFRGYAGGVVRCTDYQRADGTALAAPPTGPAFAGVRQTVAAGPVDTGGLPTFLPATDGNLNLDAQNITSNAPFVAAAANGWSAGSGLPMDRVGVSTANLVWNSLTASRAAATPNFLYVTINANGTLTPGATLLAPIYQWGGTPGITNGQFTFNIVEMKGYMGNGSTAPQSYIVFAGEAATDATGVISTVAYAYNGQYDSGYTATLPGTAVTVTKSHNIGIKPFVANFVVECTTAELGYAVGDQIINPAVANNTATYPSPVRVTTKTAARTSGSGTSATNIISVVTGAPNPATLASWKYKFAVQRGW
ncbi:MAG: hypothetical protein NTV97_20485 [Alphaproteobacteria bacterium]|nr:hypothetical protein [Alphaproteobacteria bacterium]